MELKDFVKASVSEMMDAIVEFNEERKAAGKKGNLNPKVLGSDAFEIDTIDFDIAVTAASKKAGSAGGRVNLYVASVGANGSVESDNSRVSRIRFSLGVAWPFTSIQDVKKLQRRGSERG